MNDNQKFSIKEYRDAIYQDINKKNKDNRKNQKNMIEENFY